MASKTNKSIPGVTAKRIPGVPQKAVPGAPRSISGSNRVKLHDTRGRFVKGGTGIAWEHLDVLTSNAAKTADGVHEARVMAAQDLAKKMEAYAKGNASWEDDTGNARRGLKTVVIDRPAQHRTEVSLGHTESYGIYLETRHGGRYAIITPTIQYFSFQVSDIIVGLRPLARKLG